MTRRIVEHAGRIYTFSPDDVVPLSESVWALVSARGVDEITGESPRSMVTIVADRSDLIPRRAGNGLVGLVGIPGRVFPNLATQSYNIHLTVRAVGYIPRHEEVTIAPIADFPDTFAPTDIGNLFLHRDPTVIRGRTVLATGNTTTPISGATVGITGVWWSLPPANLVVPAELPNVVSLRPPLYFPRAAATGRLRRREMTPVVGEDKHLLEGSAQGNNVLRLSNRVNLASGDIIVIDPLDSDLMEHLTIDFVLGASTADQPARVMLTYPLANPHRSNAVVWRVVPQVPGPDNPFDRDAILGDTCVFLNSMTDMDIANVVEISGGGDPAEYHSPTHFSVTSDADGYYRLPPLSRVAQLEVQADDGDMHPTITQLFSPDYTQRENRLDFVFR